MALLSIESGRKERTYLYEFRDVLEQLRHDDPLVQTTDQLSVVDAGRAREGCICIQEVTRSWNVDWNGVR